MAQNIFGTKKAFALGGLARDRYDATNLTKVIEDLVRERSPKEEEAGECLQLASPEDLCKTCVLEIQKTSSTYLGIMNNS